MGKQQSKLGQCSVNDGDDFVTVKSYKGETKNGQRHGRGLYLYPNGDMYDGEWRKSRKYGKGVYMYANGQRLEGYFYHDDYIGKEPNEKIKQRMAKKKAHGQQDNSPVIEVTELSNGQLDETNEPDLKLKADGGKSRRAESMKRNKWLRDKYDIHNNTDTPDTQRNSWDKNSEDVTDTTKNVKKSSSFVQNKRHQNREQIDFDEAAERRNSKRLRESIRKKYNLPTRD